MLPALLPYALLTLGLGGTLVLFVSLKREIQRQERRYHARISELDKKFGEMSGPRRGADLGARQKALRLLREGRDVGDIGALGLPKRELELMMRVHRH